jgi:ATP-dependent exoDNAse (exonuclease V) beta subunit
MHAVLSRMNYSDELDEMLEKIWVEGVIASDEKTTLQTQLRELLSNERIAGWFSRDWQVRTEVPVLLPGGAEYRIDRLLLKEKRAVVVDFKTGARKKADEKQVIDYMDTLRKMNFLQVEGYLLYLAENAIAEVKPGRRLKLVQKTSDKEQLDLGF